MRDAVAWSLSTAQFSPFGTIYIAASKSVDVSEQQSRRVIALVSGSHVINHAYLVILAPLVTVLATEFNVSVGAIGLAIGTQGAVVALLQIPFGELSDRRGRYFVLKICLLVGAIGATLTALAPTYWTLVAAQAVLGVGVAGHHPAHYPMLAAASTEDKRGRAYSYHALGGALGFGLPFGAVAVARILGYSWRVALLSVAIIGALYGIGCLLALRSADPRITGPAKDVDATTGSRMQDAIRSLKASVKSAPILGIAILSLVTSAAAWVIRTYAPILYEQTYGLSPEVVGLFMSAMFIVEAVLILFGGVVTDRFDPIGVMIGGYLGLTVLAVSLATGSVPLALLAIGLTFTGTITVSRPARSTLTDRLSARADLGKNFAVVSVGISAGGAIAPPVFGWLLDVIGVQLVFGLVAVLGGVCLGMTLWLDRMTPDRHPTGAPQAE